jgi:uncharacterized membrane protein YoaK (UPF0700 family)
MIRYRKRYWVVAGCLAAVAGFVDAAAFIKLGGFFVSFMSGNSTRLGVGLAGVLSHALLAGALIAAFVTGVVAGALVPAAPRDEVANTRVLYGVAGVLAFAALLGGTRSDGGAEILALGLLAFAMGAENATFQRDGEVSIGLTYMTGALVKCGQRLAAALRGAAPAFGWAPYMILWLGMLGGAILGALSFRAFGLGAIWIAAAAALVLAVLLSLLEAANRASEG